MGAKVTFDEVNKIIIITEAPVFESPDWVVDIDVKVDIYSDGKEDWLANQNLRRFVFPVRPVGGDDLPGEKSLGSTFFINSDWKIRPYSGDHVLRINGNVYSEDGTSPFVQNPGYGITIINTVSSLVDSTVQQLAEIQYSSFQNSVWVYTNSDIQGTVYPNGTRQFPVDNIADAITIANETGFGTIQLLDSIDIDGTVDLSEFELVGRNATNTFVNIAPSALVTNLEIRDCTLSGTLDGGTTVHDCNLDSLLYVNGEVHQSMLLNNIVLGGNAVAHFFDCKSGVPGDSTPTIDMGGSGQSLAMRNYSGGIEIINKSGPDAVSLDFVSGQAKIDSTVTQGTIVVRGNVKVTDNSTGDTIVEMDSVVIPESAYNGEVSMAPQTGERGIAYPFGTNTRPISDNDDAVAIAQRYNITNFSIKGTLVTDRDFPGAGVRGNGAVQTNIIVAQGHDFTNSVFSRLTITGLMTGSNIQFEECVLSDFSGVAGLLQGCGLAGTILLGGDTIGRGTTFIDAPTTIDFGVATDISLKMEIDSGTLQMNNFSANNYAQLSFSQGSLIIDSSCTGGIISLKGNVDVTDNSGGAITILDATLGQNVSLDVWNSDIGQYTIPETTGYTHLLSAYEGMIHIDSTGISGTEYPAGTPSDPVNNIDDALVLSDLYGLEELHLHDDINIGSADVSGKVFIGTGGITTNVIASGATATKSSFTDLLLTGTLTGSGMASKDTILYNLTGYNGTADNCSLGGTITMTNTDQLLGQKVTFMSSPETVLDMAYSNATASFIGDGGQVRITRCGTNNAIYTTIHGTTYIIDALCNGGTVLVRGEGVVNDLSNGTVVTDLTTSTENIAIQVWDEPIADHQVSGSTGHWMKKKLLSLANFIGLK